MRFRCLLGTVGIETGALAHARSAALRGIMDSKALVIVDGNPSGFDIVSMHR